MYKKNNYFAKNLEKLIQKNGIKKIDFAKEIGVTKSAVSNYLSEVSVPKIETIMKIASFFGVSFEQLLETDIDNPIVSLQENDKYVSVIPLFHDQLISKDVIYRRDNFLGNITSPVFLPSNSECYAVMIHDNLMKETGIAEGSVVIFDSAVSPENGNIAAVFLKNEKTIVIRRVVVDIDKISLYCDSKYDEYNIIKNNCDVHVLGKVIFATFNPNI